MPKKKPKLTGTLTVTFTFEQTDGPTPEIPDGLQDQLETDWDGLEVYFADPDEEDETVVVLTTKSFEFAPVPES
jgi:hypothetical protein